MRRLRKGGVSNDSDPAQVPLVVPKTSLLGTAWNGIPPGRVGTRVQIRLIWRVRPYLCLQCLLCVHGSGKSISGNGKGGLHCVTNRS